MRTQHRHGVAEIDAVLCRQTCQAQLVATRLELARRAEVTRNGFRRQREAGRTCGTVVDADQVAAVDAHARASYAARAQGVDRAAGLVFHAAQGIGRGRAIGVADVRDPHQQLVRRHDGVVTGGIADRVVRRCQAAGLQHASVLAGRSCWRVGATDTGSTREHRRSLTIDKTADTHPRKIGRIRLRQEPRVVVRPYAQRGGIDGAAAMGP